MSIVPQVERKVHPYTIRTVCLKITSATLLALAPLLTLAPVAVHADTVATVTICERSGHYCVGAPDGIGNGAPVSETITPSTLKRVDLGISWDNKGDVYWFEFASDTSKCLGVSSTGKGEVRNCSNANANQDWVRVGTTAHFTYINVDYTNSHNGPDYYLTGNNNGTRMYLDLRNAHPGELQVFDN